MLPSALPSSSALLEKKIEGVTATALRPRDRTGPCLAQYSGDFSPTVMASQPDSSVLARSDLRSARPPLPAESGLLHHL